MLNRMAMVMQHMTKQMNVSIFLAKMKMTIHHDEHQVLVRCQVGFFKVMTVKSTAMLDKNQFSISLGYCSEGADRDRSMSVESTALKSKSGLGQGQGHRTGNEQFFIDDTTAWINESVDETPEKAPNHKRTEQNMPNKTTVEISVHQETPTTPPAHTFSPTTIITTSSSVDTLSGEAIGLNALSGPSSPSNLSSVTLVGSTGSACNDNDKDMKGSREFNYSKAPTSPLPERKRKSIGNETAGKAQTSENGSKTDTTLQKTTESDDATKNTKVSETTTVSSKPKIVSALTKTAAKDDGNKGTSSQQSTPSKTSSNVLQPMSYLTMNRRPSAGTIGVPVAALSQHRRSLQLNSSEGGFGMSKVSTSYFAIFYTLP